MIDYDKLKIAHELADKLRTTINFSVILHANIFFDGRGKCRAVYDLHAMERNTTHYNIDDLIAKLTELTETEKPKFEEGSAVFWTFNNIIYSGKTDSITRCGEQFRYQIQMDHGEINLHEEQLYPTRESLIIAQLECWSKLAYEERSKSVYD